MKKTAAFFCMLLIIGLLAKLSYAAKIVQPFVNVAEGDVTVKPGSEDSWIAAEKGRVLYGMDTLRTGQASRAELVAPSGTIRLYQNTVMTVPEVYSGDEGIRDISTTNIENGTGTFRIKRRGKKNRFTVSTKHVFAVVKGTIFTVRCQGKESLVACLFGRVVVSPKDGPFKLKKIYLGPGEMVLFHEDRGFGEKIRFENSMYTWNRWNDHFALEDFTEREPRSEKERDREGCPPDDVLWNNQP